MKNIELENCIFADDGEVEIEGVGKIPSEEMEHIVAYWLEITSDNSDYDASPKCNHEFVTRFGVVECQKCGIRQS